MTTPTKPSELLTHLPFREEDATEPGLQAVDERERDPLLATIDGLLGLSDYTFATRTLRGIYDTVRATGRSTPAQRMAIQHIKESATKRLPGRFGGWGRRYDR